MNIRIALNGITEYYFPRIIESLNDHYVKLAKINGNSVPLHNHENSDELFYILEGRLLIEIMDESPVVLEKGDLFVVRKGTYHRVSSEEECHVLLIEAKETLHTGREISDITRKTKDQFY